MRVFKTLLLINDGFLIEYPQFESRAYKYHSKVYKAVDRKLTRLGKVVIKPGREAMEVGVMIVEKSQNRHLIING